MCSNITRKTTAKDEIRLIVPAAIAYLVIDALTHSTRQAISSNTMTADRIYDESAVGQRIMKIYSYYL